MSKSVSLPILDLQQAKTARTETAKKLVDALENVGFLYVDNVEGLDFDKLYECCRWFFGQKKELKDGLLRKYWKPENPNGYRGYFPVLENQPSRKEGFEFARDVDPNDPTIAPGNWFYEPSVWPKEDGAFPFKEFLQATYDVMHETGMEILRLACVGLGIDELSFHELFDDKPMSTFRLLHYPPWDGAPPDNATVEDGKIVITPDHTDSGFLTLLCLFNYGGLEVLSADGHWTPVDPRPNSLIMNIGDVFSRLMGGRFKATRHRVMDIGVDRYSVPFFLEPKYDGDVGINFISKVTGHGPAHIEEPYGPWVLKQMKYVKKFYEFELQPDI